VQPLKKKSIFRLNQQLKLMKTTRLLSILLLSAFALTSCDWHTTRTVIGFGDVESEEREATNFSGITATGTCTVYITTGDTCSLELSAQPQILDVMTSSVRSGILHIGFEPDYNIKTGEEISATIVVPSLDFVSITRLGNVEISGEKQPRLDIHITGEGNVEAYGMEVENCNINITGMGNCKVNVSDELDVKISGVGNVFYKGNPELTTDISGLGKATAVDL
jgi:predicted small secreted protein